MLSQDVSLNQVMTGYHVQLLNDTINSILGQYQNFSSFFDLFNQQVNHRFRLVNQGYSLLDSTIQQLQLSLSNRIQGLNETLMIPAADCSVSAVFQNLSDYFATIFQQVSHNYSSVESNLQQLRLDYFALGNTTQQLQNNLNNNNYTASNQCDIYLLCSPLLCTLWLLPNQVHQWLHRNCVL